MGIDGGGTGSALTIRDATRRVLRARGGPLQLARMSAPDLRTSLAALCAGIDPSARSRVAAVCIGAAGATTPERIAPVAAWLSDTFPYARARVVRDLDLVLAEADDGPAVALIAGTGAVAVARDADGNELVLDGRGFMAGDRGSAHWIGHRALGRALRALDMDGIASPLLESLCDALDVDGPGSVSDITRTGAVPVTRIAALAPVILRAAEAGDPLARAVVADAADALADTAWAAISRGADPDATLLLAGGLLLGALTVRERVTADLLTRGWSGQVREVRDPSASAVSIARTL